MFKSQNQLIRLKCDCFTNNNGSFGKPLKFHHVMHGNLKILHFKIRPYIYIYQNIPARYYKLMLIQFQISESKTKLTIQEKVPLHHRCC